MIFPSSSRITECTAPNVRGIAYQELWCLYPWMEPFYTNFEKAKGPDLHRWLVDNPQIPVISVGAYVCLILAGKGFMKNRKPYNFRRSLAFWNLFLSIFSFVGLLRTLPQLLHNMVTMTSHEIFCGDAEVICGSGSTGYWIFAFVFSKIPELLDTFFLVVHKKPIIFLHWYHHITVLLYCWHSYATKAPAGVFFAVMNYAVHAIMYGYYYLTCRKIKPSWMNPMLITCAQISQMIVGVTVQVISFYYYQTTKSLSTECSIQKQNVIAGSIMYGSYLFLFVQFFIGRYFIFNKTSGKIKKMK